MLFLDIAAEQRRWHVSELMAKVKLQKILRQQGHTPWSMHLFSIAVCAGGDLPTMPALCTLCQKRSGWLISAADFAGPAG